MEIKFPPKCEILFKPKRFKILYGGRGSAKSWSIARALLLLSTKKKLRVLCARELQNSIQESVHKLLTLQIEALGLQKFFTIQQASIFNIFGSEFFFEGIRNNADKIKSYEGIDICWVEEADRLTKSSWEILIPTIRSIGSEIWCSLNPKYPEDEAYQRFLVKSGALDSGLDIFESDRIYAVKMNWKDNPWFNETLNIERLACERDYPEDYAHIWEGQLKLIIDGAVFGKELGRVSAEGRFCEIKYQRGCPVHTFWDLGKGDATVIWFVQLIGSEIHLIDYYENTGEDLDHYFTILQEKRYLYGVHYLPHDAKHNRIGMKRTIQGQFRDMGLRTKIVPRTSIPNKIAAARAVFPNCYFNENKCRKGIEALRKYAFEVDEETRKFSKNPKHDEWSNGADAFQYMGLTLKVPSAMKIREEMIEEVAEEQNGLRLAGIGSQILGWMR